MDYGLAQGIYSNKLEGNANGLYDSIRTGLHNGIYNENILQYNIIKNGLVFYLDAGNKFSYPRNTITCNDLSNNFYNGILYNGTSFNYLNKGSFVFDGTNDYIQTIKNFAFGLNPFTINIWFKSLVFQSANSTLISIASPQSDFNWQLSFISNTLNFFYGASNIASSYISNNQWTNITIIRNSTSINGSSIYINSNFDKNFTSINNYTDENGYRIGMNRGSNAWYNGNISNIQIYNRALSESEITYNNTIMKTRFI